MTRYPHREYKSGGIGVQIKPTGGKKHMPGAFFIRFANGVQAIVIRTSSAAGMKYRSTGLEVKYGPSTSQVFTDVKDDLQAPSGNRLMQRLGYEAEQLLKRQ